MISRLTAIAAVFAVLTTATLAFATSAPHTAAAPAATAQATPVIQLERVVITGRRLPN